MTTNVKRIALGVGASMLALGVSVGVYATGQNTHQDPNLFRSGGPGGPGRGGPGGLMGMLPMLGPKIGLTDAQRDQIKTIAESHKDEWKALADRERTARAALNGAVTADAIDEASIRLKSAEVAAVDADVAVARAHAHAEVFQILTSEQKAQVKKMQTEMKNWMRNRPQARVERIREVPEGSRGS
jgi:Spy/CpxP family protein refolding chaperone